MCKRLTCYYSGPPVVKDFGLKLLFSDAVALVDVAKCQSSCKWQAASSIVKQLEKIK